MSSTIGFVANRLFVEYVLESSFNTRLPKVICTVKETSPGILFIGVTVIRDFVGLRNITGGLRGWRGRVNRVFPKVYYVCFVKDRLLTVRF